MRDPLPPGQPPEPWKLITWWLFVAMMLGIGIGALLVTLSGCSSTAQRFDKRPDLCRDLGKRGSDC